MSIKKLINKIKNKIREKFERKIYVIGDSHSCFFSGTEHPSFISTKFININTCPELIAFFKTYHLGPALAYNINKTQTTTQSLEKILCLIDNKIIPPKSTIMLSYGEIDIRVHIIKQAEIQNKSVDYIIDNILTNYLEFIKMLQSQGFNIICWGPIATQKDTWSSNPDYPRTGTEVERNKATEIFNNKLRDLSYKHNFIYCSIFKDLIDNNYQTKAEYICDECHLAQTSLPLMFKELLEKKVLIMHKRNKSIKLNI